MKTTTYQWPTRLMWLILPVFLLASAAYSLQEAILNKDTNRAIKEIPLSFKDALQDKEAALHLAVEQELVSVVKMLIMYGANINAISAQGETATDIAFELKNMELIKILVDNNGQLEKHINTDLRAFVLIEEILKSSDGRDLFPFICPLFFLDIGVFRNLRNLFQEKKFDAWTIADVLGSLAVERFPSGLPSEEALLEMKLLLEEINASENLRTRIYFALENRPYDVQIDFPPPLLLDEKKIYDISGLNIIKLARALTIRESRLFKALTTWNFVDWLYGIDSQRTIFEFLSFSTHGSAVFIRHIKQIAEQNDRSIEAKKLVKIGSEFLKLKNFSGVKMVVAALSELTSMKLIKLKKNDNVAYQKLKKVVSQDNSYQEYFKHLSKVPISQPYIPILGILLNNLANYRDLNIQMTNLDYIIKIALTLQEINSIKNKRDYKFNTDIKLNIFLNNTPFNYGLTGT